MPRVYKDAKEDAEELRDAMKGFGTDDSTLISIICDRQPWQLEQIADAYESEFGKPLIKKIKSETRGNYEDFLVGLLSKRNDYIADSLKDAVEGLGTDERAIIDVLCCLDNEDLEEVKDNKDVFEAVMDDVSGEFKKVIKSLLEADRDEADKVPDLSRAAKDAKRFYRAGKGFGTNDKKYISIMTKRSNAHLQLVNRIYEKLYEKTMEDSIKSETSGAYEKALRGLLKPFDHYWAERFHKAMEGFGTDDDALVRSLVLCGKRRIPHVAAKYEELYGNSLSDDISGETSGDFKKAMLEFLKVGKGRGELRNPLAAYQEISIDGVDEDGDVDAVELPFDGGQYILCSGGQEYHESLKVIAKEGTDDIFFLQFRDGNNYLSRQNDGLLSGDNQGPWEEFKFEVHPEDPSKLAIRTHFSTFVSFNPDDSKWSDKQCSPGEQEMMEMVEDFS